MAMYVRELNCIILDIPNSEATKNNQIKTIKESEVGYYYTDDNVSKQKLILDFFGQNELTYVIDYQRTNQYISDVKQKVTPFKKMFRGELKSIYEYSVLTKDIAIKKMFFTGKGNRYFSFNKEDKKSLDFYNILLGRITFLVIIKEENNFRVYPVLKENYDYYFVDKQKDRALFYENFDEIVKFYKKTYGDQWLEKLYLENLNLFSFLLRDIKLRESFINTLNKYHDNTQILFEEEVNKKLPNDPKTNFLTKLVNNCNNVSYSKNNEIQSSIRPEIYVDFDRELKFDNLYFEDETTLKKSIKGALKSGKNIILLGPPGTGKSKLAKEIANSYGVSSKMVTAMSDWSTYDTIGGYKPNIDGTLYFDSGIFLSAIKENNEIKNNWLIIDEMNRADIDKAFGSFFSTLSGDDVNLGLKVQNKSIELKLESSEEKITELDSHQFVIPKDWRLIGTLNTFDKASLYEMSYAFMRRFAFIQVNIPRNITYQTLMKYLTLWQINLNSEDVSDLIKLWKLINNYMSIGPAIIKDIAHFIENGGDYTAAIAAYVLPQFEGLFEDELMKFYHQIKEESFIEDQRMLKDYFETFFGMKIEK